jgi:hypothetical protein
LLKQLAWRSSSPNSSMNHHRFDSISKGKQWIGSDVTNVVVDSGGGLVVVLVAAAGGSGGRDSAWEPNPWAEREEGGGDRLCRYGGGHDKVFGSTGWWEVAVHTL